MSHRSGLSHPDRATGVGTSGVAKARRRKRNLKSSVVGYAMFLLRRREAFVVFGEASARAAVVCRRA